MAHQEPDRVPFDLSATGVSGIHKIAYRGLRAELGLEDREPITWHLMQQLAVVEEDVHEALGSDLRGAYPGSDGSWNLKITEDPDYYYDDEFHITRKRQKPDGLYFDLCGSPLADATGPADVEAFGFPDPTEAARFDGLRELAERTHAEGRAFVLGGICPGFLETSQWLRGYVEAFTDLVANRPLAEALYDKILEIKLRYWEEALGRLGDVVDVVREGDDYGGQDALLISPSQFRELFKPRFTELIRTIKSLAPHATLFFHSCGNVREIIPDLIDAGVEALNPIQVAAADMDTKELKAEFGDDLTFWGGGADTQHVLPLGTPEQVRDKTRRRIDDLAPGGGFIFTPVHNIQADVPPRNIIAMWEALREHGAYPIGGQ